MNFFFCAPLGLEQGTIISRHTIAASEREFKVRLWGALEFAGNPETALVSLRFQDATVLGMAFRSGRRERGVSERTARHSFWGWRIEHSEKLSLTEAIWLLSVYPMISADLDIGYINSIGWLESILDTDAQSEAECREILNAIGGWAEKQAQRMHRLGREGFDVFSTSSDLVQETRNSDEIKVHQAVKDQDIFDALVIFGMKDAKDWLYYEDIVIGIHDLDGSVPFSVLKVTKLVKSAVSRQETTTRWYREAGQPPSNALRRFFGRIFGGNVW